MRNYEKEAARERQIYKRYQYRCPKPTAERLDEKLKADKVTFSGWIKAKIEEYLRGDVQ